MLILQKPTSIKKKTSEPVFPPDQYIDELDVIKIPKKYNNTKLQSNLAL